MNPKNLLKRLDFTDGEIKIYLSLFELGETTAGPLVKQSKVTYSKVYPILNKLIEKGLVTHVIKEGIKYFSATNPQSLIELLERRERALQEEKKELKEVIPKLLAKQKDKTQAQQARVFEGFKGLRNLFYELFNKSTGEKEILVFGLNKILEKKGFVSFFKFYHDLRIKNNIKLKLLLNKETKCTIEKKYKKADMYKKTDQIKYTENIFPTGVFIFKNHVINIIADDKVTAFDVISEQNAKRYKKFFKEMWRKE